MKRLRYAFLLIFAFCFIGVFAGCGDDGYCTIGVVNPEHATIVSEETKVEEGKYISFDIECDPGYEVDYVTINGQALGQNERWDRYKVTKDITISCVVKLTEFEIVYNNLIDARFEPTTTTFTILTNNINLPSPTKVGADFDGWYINGQKVTSIDPSEHIEDVNVYAHWKEHFNSEIEQDSWTGEIYRVITSLTEHGRTLKNLEIPALIDGTIVKGVRSLTEDDSTIISIDKLKLNEYITDVSDEVWASVKAVSVVDGNEYLVHEDDFIYYVDGKEKVLRFINDTYFAENNDTLYIEKDVSGVEIFYQPDAVSKIKRFMVDSENEYLNVKTSENYTAVEEEEGYTQGNVLYSGNDLVRYVSCGETSFTVASTVNTIYDYAFKDSVSLEEITFEVEEIVGDTTTYNGTEYINRNAFEGCKAIRSIQPPKTLKRIDDYAFKDCHSLIDLPGLALTKLYYLGVKVFAHTNLYTLRLPETMTGRGNFYKQRVISAFEDSKIVRVDLSSPLNSDIDNILEGTRYSQSGRFITNGDFVFLEISDEEYKLVAYTGTDETIILPEKVSLGTAIIEQLYVDYTIDTYFLYYNQYVKNVYLNTSGYFRVKTINSSAFYNCEKLESLMIYEETEVKSWAVNGCENFDTVYAYLEQENLEENMAEDWNTNDNEIVFFDYGYTYAGKTVWHRDSDGNLILVTE